MTTRKDRARLVGVPKTSARARLAETAQLLDIELHIDEAETLHALMRAAIQDKQANRLYTSY